MGAEAVRGGIAGSIVGSDGSGGRGRIDGRAAND